MSFLDRFKTQPKYRNPDPAIRLAGVAELPDDAEHWGVIAELAASDEDVRVRRAAIARIGVVGYLARIARTERDESLRRELSERLIAIANAAADGDGDAAAALDGLSDQKHFGTIAKSSPHDTVRTAALGKDSRRQGARERRAACGRRADCARGRGPRHGSGRARRRRRQDGPQGCGRHRPRARRRGDDVRRRAPRAPRRHRRHARRTSRSPSARRPWSRKSTMPRRPGRPRARSGRSGSAS